ncbi:MAG: acyl carrier protein [Planctomycetes bacterium]|nr:acyl carrier protein [Planctomycetota bacterium]
MSDPSLIVRQLLARACAIDPAEVRDENLLVQYGLDSVRAVDFIVSLEEAFGLQVPDEDVARIRTVADVAAYIRRRTEGKPA